MGGLEIPLDPLGRVHKFRDERVQRHAHFSAARDGVRTYRGADAQGYRQAHAHDGR